MTTPDTDRARIVDRIFEGIGCISTPMMGGDNLAVTLCSRFENPDQDACDETGWTEDAIKGHDEVLAAIRAHLQPLADLIEQDGRTIEALRAEVKTVLQREADTIRRHDARIDAAEPRIAMRYKPRSAVSS